MLLNFKKMLFPLLILICALGLSSTAAFYSITGLSLLFFSTRIPVIIMASFLELSKITIAALLHRYWKTVGWFMKSYLIVALLILMIITSAGVYGLLSSGYQSTSDNQLIQNKEIEFIESNIKNQENSIKLNTVQLTQINQSISKLRENLGNNNQTYQDKKGNIISSSSSSNRKAYENQLKIAIESENKIKKEIKSSDSIIVSQSKLKLEKETLNNSSNELGPLKYLSKLTKQPMDIIINWLILCIVVVFDPLAISLIIASSFAFSQIKSKDKILEKQDIIEEYNGENPIKIPLPQTEMISIQDETHVNDTKDENVSSWRRNKMESSTIKTYN